MQWTGTAPSSIPYSSLPATARSGCAAERCTCTGFAWLLYSRDRIPDRLAVDHLCKTRKVAAGRRASPGNRAESCPQLAGCFVAGHGWLDVAPARAGAPDNSACWQVIERRLPDHRPVLGAGAGVARSPATPAALPCRVTWQRRPGMRRGTGWTGRRRAVVVDRHVQCHQRRRQVVGHTLILDTLLARARQTVTFEETGSSSDRGCQTISRPNPLPK